MSKVNSTGLSRGTRSQAVVGNISDEQISPPRRAEEEGKKTHTNTETNRKKGLGARGEDTLLPASFYIFIIDTNFYYKKEKERGKAKRPTIIYTHIGLFFSYF